MEEGAAQGNKRIGGDKSGAASGRVETADACSIVKSKQAPETSFAD